MQDLLAPLVNGPVSLPTVCCFDSLSYSNLIAGGVDGVVLTSACFFTGMGLVGWWLVGFGLSSHRP